MRLTDRDFYADTRTAAISFAVAETDGRGSPPGRMREKSVSRHPPMTPDAAHDSAALLVPLGRKAVGLQPFVT